MHVKFWLSQLKYSFQTFDFGVLRHLDHSSLPSFRLYIDLHSDLWQCNRRSGSDITIICIFSIYCSYTIELHSLENLSYFQLMNWQFINNVINEDVWLFTGCRVPFLIHISSYFFPKNIVNGKSIYPLINLWLLGKTTQAKYLVNWVHDDGFHSPPFGVLYIGVQTLKCDRLEKAENGVEYLFPSTTQIYIYQGHR